MLALSIISHMPGLNLGYSYVKHYIWLALAIWYFPSQKSRSINVSLDSIFSWSDPIKGKKFASLYQSVCIRIVSSFLRYYENFHPTVKNYWLREKAFLGNNVSLNIKWTMKASWDLIILLLLLVWWLIPMGFVSPAGCSWVTWRKSLIFCVSAIAVWVTQILQRVEVREGLLTFGKWKGRTRRWNDSKGWNLKHTENMKLANMNQGPGSTVRGWEGMM